jgi:hypothetical protein
MDTTSFFSVSEAELLVEVAHQLDDGKSYGPYICVCVCVCICMCMYVCICVYVCMCIWRHVSSSMEDMHDVCVYVCIFMCMYACICSSSTEDRTVPIYACMRVCMCMYACICRGTSARRRKIIRSMYMYVCVYVCLYMQLVD